MCSFAKVSLEENRELLFRAKTGGRMNEETSFITRYPAAGEQRRGSGCWKVATAGRMAGGTCGELQRARH